LYRNITPSLFTNMLRTLKPKPPGPSDDTPPVAPQAPGSSINTRDSDSNSGPTSKTFHLLPRNPRTIRKLNRIKAAREMRSASTKKVNKSKRKESGPSRTGGTTAETYTLEPSQQESITAALCYTDYSATNDLVTADIESYGNAEMEEEDSEQQWSAHLTGAHNGRDPYEVASKPYLEAGLPPLWKRCRWCEEIPELQQSTGG
ncbi:hypothetical protein COCC4DRAFT_124868, partial [Bipolaris maydis ATCC 48331]